MGIATNDQQDKQNCMVGNERGELDDSYRRTGWVLRINRFKSQDSRKITGPFRGIHKYFPQKPGICQLVTGWSWKFYMI